MRDLETTQARPLPENTDGPRAARRTNMPASSDVRKAIQTLRKDLDKGPSYLRHLVDEVERHFDLKSSAPDPAPAPVVEAPAAEVPAAPAVPAEATPAPVAAEAAQDTPRSW
jgi:hypothetical protein